MTNFYVQRICYMLYFFQIAKGVNDMKEILYDCLHGFLITVSCTLGVALVIYVLFLMGALQ